MLNAPRGEDMTQKFVQEISTIYSTYTTQHMPLEVESPDDTVVTRGSIAAWSIHSTARSDRCRDATVGGAVDCSPARALPCSTSAMVWIFCSCLKGDPWALAEEPAVPAKDSIHNQSVGGRPVAMWKRGGITYSMVGDLPRDELADSQKRCNTASIKGTLRPNSAGSANVMGTLPSHYPAACT